MTRLPTAILAIPVLVVALGGCAGTGGSGRTALGPAAEARADRDLAIDDARRAFERAKAAGGERAAPFEFHLAEEYLALAVHEAREADMTSVVGFAKRSEAHSRAAIQEAEGEAK